MTHNSHKAGFALPMVLTIVAILTLTYAVCLNQLVFLTRETRQAIQRAAFDRVAMSAEARLSYLVTTEPFGAGALNIGSARNTSNANGQLTQPVVDASSTLTMDDRPYRFLENSDSTVPFLARVQDEAGLFNLYGATVDQLTRLFTQLGELDDRDAGNLATEVQTYNVDSTAHQPLRRPSAIFSRIAGMADLFPPRVRDRLLDKITAYPDNLAFNINTAPADVIAILFNVDETTAQSVVDNREGTTIGTLNSIGLTSPDPAKAYTFSGGRLRFTFSDPKSGLTYRSSLILTPTNAERPLWVENPRTTVTPPPADVEVNDLDPFPDIPDLTS